MDHFKETTLEGHVQLCELRYKSLEEKINAVEARLTTFEARLTKMETAISAVKNDMSSGFSDIKLLIEKQDSARTVQLIATLGTVAVATISLLGYVIMH